MAEPDLSEPPAAQQRDDAQEPARDEFSDDRVRNALLLILAMAALMAIAYVLLR